MALSKEVFQTAVNMSHNLLWANKRCLLHSNTQILNHYQAEISLQNLFHAADLQQFQELFQLDAEMSFEAAGERP